MRIIYTSDNERMPWDDGYEREAEVGTEEQHLV